MQVKALANGGAGAPEEVQLPQGGGDSEVVGHAGGGGQGAGPLKADHRRGGGHRIGDEGVLRRDAAVPERQGRSLRNVSSYITGRT